METKFSFVQNNYVLHGNYKNRLAKIANFRNTAGIFEQSDSAKVGWRQYLHNDPVSAVPGIVVLSCEVRDMWSERHGRLVVWSERHETPTRMHILRFTLQVCVIIIFNWKMPCLLVMKSRRAPDEL